MRVYVVAGGGGCSEASGRSVGEISGYLGKRTQTDLARLLPAVDVRPIDEQLGGDAGILTGRARTRDPIDATVVLIASHGDRILTSDAGDLKRLAAAGRKRVAVLPC